MYTYVKNIISALRLAEVSLMSGFFLIGYVFAIDNRNEFNLSEAGLMVAYIFLYILSVYTLNSYCDYKHDKQNNRLKQVSLISRKTYLYLTIINFNASLLLAGLINFKLCLLIIAGFIIWLLYYLPPIKLKSSLYAGTALHFIAAVIHFHMGYMVLKPISVLSICVGLYFSLLLSMGHLNHEIIDYEADKRVGIKNTTVQLGIAYVQDIMLLLFILSIGYLLALSAFNFVKQGELLCFEAPSIILLFLIKLASRKLSSAQAFQKYYRYVFLVGGLSLTIVKAYWLLN